MFVTTPDGTGEEWDEVPRQFVRPGVNVKMQLRNGAHKAGKVRFTMQQWIVLENDGDPLPVEEIVRMELEVGKM